MIVSPDFLAEVARNRLSRKMSLSTKSWRRVFDLKRDARLSQQLCLKLRPALYRNVTLIRRATKIRFLICSSRLIRKLPNYHQLMQLNWRT